MDFKGTIYAMAGSMKNPYFVFNDAVVTAASTLRALEPGIVTRTGDIEQLAHAAYLEYRPVGRNKSKFHF
jgi:hypothetical protein